uniref:Uncharacterized protein n=1 Tax=Utricularia reniformis TaxID=192314 RepID=A0A1Y0B289_9LAMI|nr:hypothetical protein AEK19_MT1354 [Utricularia reniformis]ART31552.1 hypothetical protein AEK19_MT1354 [Utricularia reniformis]
MAFLVDQFIDLVFRLQLLDSLMEKVYIPGQGQDQKRCSVGLFLLLGRITQEDVETPNKDFEKEDIHFGSGFPFTNNGQSYFPNLHRNYQPTSGRPG